MKTLHEVHTCILAFWHKMCQKRTLGMTISSVTQSMNRCKVSENVLKAIIILKAYQLEISTLDPVNDIYNKDL